MGNNNSTEYPTFNFDSNKDTMLNKILYQEGNPKFAPCLDDVPSQELEEPSTAFMVVAPNRRRMSQKEEAPVITSRSPSRRMSQEVEAPVIVSLSQPRMSQEMEAPVIVSRSPSRRMSQEMEAEMESGVETEEYEVEESEESEVEAEEAEMEESEVEESEVEVEESEVEESEVEAEEVEAEVEAEAEAEAEEAEAEEAEAEAEAISLRRSPIQRNSPVRTILMENASDSESFTSVDSFNGIYSKPYDTNIKSEPIKISSVASKYLSKRVSPSRMRSTNS